MISWFIQKLRNYIGVWLIYLVGIALVGLITTFFIMPLVGYFRFGVVQFLPNPEFAIKMVKAVVYGSLVLALVMWLLAEWETMEQREATSKPMKKGIGNES